MKTLTRPMADKPPSRPTKQPRVLSELFAGKTSEPSWSELPTDLWPSILKLLPSIYLLPVRTVCSSWNSAVELYLSSPMYKPSFKSPTLMLPHKGDSDSRCFFNLAEKKVHTVKKVFQGLDDDWWCMGASHGFLIVMEVMEKHAQPYLLNPFSGSRLKLPSLSHVSHVKMFVFPKAILSSDPDLDTNFGVVAINGYSSHELAFWVNGGCVWTKLKVGNPPILDIMSHNGQIYILGNNGSIEVWNFQGPSLVRIQSIQACFPFELEIKENFPSNKFFSQFYLVESKGRLLMVHRLIGYFVNAEGEVMEEADLLTDEDSHPLVCPYRTKNFYVYELDLSQEKWVRIKSLDDQVLLVGGSQSESVSVQYIPELEGNSIYFTDNNWDEIDIDYLYGGHDMGIFNLHDSSVKPLYEYGDGKISPPPFFIFPRLCDKKMSQF